jgi:inner membrane protein YhjD
VAKQTTKQNFFERLVSALDRFQCRHRFAGFPYAVIKKYGDDVSGYQAALITYYGFLSLFPLLIVATSIIGLVSQHNDALRERLMNSVGSYFPAIGEQLQSSVHTSKTTGVALIIGLLFALYGAKGSADALRHALDHAWEVPKQQRPGFPKNTLKSLSLIVGGGIGLVASAFLSSYATVAVSHTVWLRAIPLVISLILTYLVFLFVFKVGSARKHKLEDIRLGALIAAIALLVLQIVGSFLVKHQLHNARTTNAQFAVVLVLLFWIYLQAQVIMYAIQINVIHTLKLWPRSLGGKDLTKADRQALALYVHREKLQEPPEEVAVRFKSNHSL